MRALVVEDEAALRESLRTQLAAAGFSVDVAQDGQEGLFAAMEYPLDVALIDLGLPQLSGLEVIRVARNLRSDWPAVIITGHADAAAIADRPPDVPLVTKPFTIDTLIGAIASVMARAVA